MDAKFCWSFCPFKVRNGGGTYSAFRDDEFVDNTRLKDVELSFIGSKLTSLQWSGYLSSLDCKAVQGLPGSCRVLQVRFRTSDYISKDKMLMVYSGLFQFLNIVSGCTAWFAEIWMHAASCVWVPV